MVVKLSGPVGRRFRSQNVTNSIEDQGKVIGLLAKIKASKGGKQEEWVTPPLTGPAGTCPPALEEAIWDFQEFWKREGHFHNIDGVVDTDKNTLLQLNLLAGGAEPPKPPPGRAQPFIIHLAQNPNITLDGTKAVERVPPIHPADWVRRTRETFETVMRHPLGKQIVTGIRRKVLVEPDPKHDVDAGVTPTPEMEFMRFTAENFDGHSEPGASADEMLLHECIHIADGHFFLYDDVPNDDSITFDRTDFLTIIGTNVYSSSLGRRLRARHNGFGEMPKKFRDDANEHVSLWRVNYEKAIKANPTLFNQLKNQPAAWNPFKLFAP